MKTIQSYILERLVLSKHNKYYTTTVEELTTLYLTNEHGNLEYGDIFGEEPLVDCWMLPYEINGETQDTNPDNWDEQDIMEIQRVLEDNADTEINVVVEEVKYLNAWSYSFELEWQNSNYKFCWNNTINFSNKLK